nr:DUF2752 domain-containing protein [uncultured Agathobaculum sp.]
MISKQDIRALVIIALFYGGMQLAGITCPIRFLTGVSCAGCGMSRAWLALLRLDFAAAWAYHPLFWLPVPVALVLLLRHRLPRWLTRTVVVAACALLLAVYAVRMLQPEDTVVVFQPETGLLYRMFCRLTP